MNDRMNHHDNQSEFDEPSTYARRQRAHDVAYERAYDEWVEQLPPEQRRKLTELGLGKADVGRTGGSGFQDIADSPRCSTKAIDLPATDDPGIAEAPVPASEKSQELLRRIIGELLNLAQVRLSLDCLALVTGLSYEGDSMTAIAMRHDVTRAAVSKRCVELTLALNLSPSRAMRSLSARDHYRRSRHAHLETTATR